jgi:3-(3-hydroxy-phenyl)propionate hydroxylase
MTAETFRYAPAYELPTYAYLTPPELSGRDPGRYPVVIVGAGLSGLILACDLAQRGIRSVLLDEDNTVGVRGASSRGICYAQKTLEILDCLGLAERALEKGVAWSRGRTFSNMDEVYSFNLQTASVSEQPAFINLQQFYLEGFLVDRIEDLGLTDLRWKSQVTRVQSLADHVRLEVGTPEGHYDLQACYVVDATGANSPLRTQLGLPTHAALSSDRWCIADVRFTKPLPTERWTWVDAPFNAGRAVWQHLMPDSVWRMDYQMPEDADVDHITHPQTAGARLREQLGPDVDFEFVWIGAYQYRQHLLDDFRHGRLFFMGDSAHVVSPFGARGGNTGVQDAFNLGWKLAMALEEKVPDSFLMSYTAERRPACAENLQVTSRTARFLAPRSPAERILRRAVLDLARRHEFARPLVNTGRMSVANDYPASQWLPQGARTVQNLRLEMANGACTRLMALLRGDVRFLAFWFAPEQEPLHQAQALMQAQGLPVRVLVVGGPQADLLDPEGRLARHLGLDPTTAAGTLCLVRPDAYLGATLAGCTPDALLGALRTALGLT